MDKGAIIIEGHVQGLSNTRSLGEMGIPVYVLDVCHCLAQHSKYCTKYFRCPDFKSPGFIDFLCELAEKEGIRDWILVPSNDHIVENLSLNKKRIEKYYKTVVPDKNILYNIINKKNLLEIASRCGTSIPGTCYIDNIQDAKMMRFPLLIKGNLGLSFFKATHSKAIQVDDYESLEKTISNIKSHVDLNDIMIQELIPYQNNIKVVSFTCFAEDGIIKCFWMGQKIREHPIKYGTATCAESIYNEDILSEATPLVKALNYTGVCEIEYLFDYRDKKFKLIEINPRTWLWVGLAKECGVDYAKILYNYLNGIPQSFNESYTTGLKWINHVTDFYFSVKTIIKGQLSIKNYLNSLRGKKINAIFSTSDIKPGLVFPFMLFYIKNKRG